MRYSEKCGRTWKYSRFYFLFNQFVVFIATVSSINYSWSAMCVVYLIAQQHYHTPRNSSCSMHTNFSIKFLFLLFHQRVLAFAYTSAIRAISASNIILIHAKCGTREMVFWSNTIKNRMEPIFIWLSMWTHCFLSFFLSLFLSWFAWPSTL